MHLNELTGEVEAVSKIYAARYGIERDDAWFILKLHEEVGELTQAFLMRVGQARAKGQTSDEIECGFRAELADVLAHTLLIAQRFGVDLETEIHSKWLMRNPDKVMQS